MRKYIKFFKFLIGGFLILVLSGCMLVPLAVPLLGLAGAQSMLSGPGNEKTLKEGSLQEAIPALANFKQIVVPATHEETGIWVPKDIDTIKGGEYKILVIMNGNATRQDFLKGRDGVLSLYPGIKITKTEEISKTPYYPDGTFASISLRFKLKGQTLQGDVYTVSIPPQAQKSFLFKRSSHRKGHR